MSVLDLMRTRYTTKHYDASRRLTDAQWADILEVLRLAPSSVNSQPWHFHVIRTDAARDKIMPAIKDFNIERMVAHDFIIFTVPATTDTAYWEALYQKEKADGRFRTWTSPERPDGLRLSNVPYFIEHPDEWHLYASNQAYLAVGCLMVALADMGIDSTLLGGVDFEVLDRVMGLEKQNQRSILGIAMGYRADNDGNATRPKSRWEKEAIIHEFQ